MIETERLFFRKLMSDDLPWLIEMRSPEPVNRYLGGTNMQNPDSLAKRLQFYIGCYDKFGFGNCAMGLKETGELIGTSGLQPLEDTGEIEVGYSIIKDYWGLGLGTEACRGWLDYGFNKYGLERIIAVAHPGNAGSMHIMEKNGMKYEKNIFAYEADCVMYGISKDEFNALSKK